MCRRGALTVPSINMSHFLHFTTWQAGQTRKGITNLPLHVGDSQTLFHTSCGYAFVQNAELLSRQYPENQKSRSQEPTKSTPDPECQSCIFWFSFKRQLLVFTFAALPKKYFFDFTALKPLFYAVSSHFLHKTFYKKTRSLFLHFFQILCYNRRNL